VPNCGGLHLKVVWGASAVQEGVRFVQCGDNAVNSILGGTAAGYGATRIHGGSPLIMLIQFYGPVERLDS
jgi:hypothetical protein